MKTIYGTDPVGNKIVRLEGTPAGRDFQLTIDEDGDVCIELDPAGHWLEESAVVFVNGGELLKALRHLGVAESVSDGLSAPSESLR